MRCGRIDNDSNVRNDTGTTDVGMQTAVSGQERSVVGRWASGWMGGGRCEENSGDRYRRYVEKGDGRNVLTSRDRFRRVERENRE